MTRRHTRPLALIAALVLAAGMLATPTSAAPPRAGLCENVTGDALTRCLYSDLDDRLRALGSNPGATPTPTPSPSATPSPSLSPTPTSSPSSTADTAAARLGWGAPTAGDEFNYVGAPDPNKWSVYQGPGHSGNGTRDRDRWYVNGSYVQVDGLPSGSTGGMSSRFDRADSSKVVAGAVSGGRWETRMRVYGATPANYRASGYHPVLIVWPDAGRTCATKRQEIDYSEGTSDVTKARTYLHYADSSCNDTTKDGHAAKVIDQRQWHNYAVEWKSDKGGTRPGHVTTYIDGQVLYHTTDPNKVPDYPSHSTIQLDNFLGDLSESHMDVDRTSYWKFS